MKFNLTKVSDVEYEETVEINTVEELMKLAKERGAIIIDGSNHITIYDDYLE